MREGNRKIDNFSSLMNVNKTGNYINIGRNIMRTDGMKH